MSWEVSAASLERECGAVAKYSGWGNVLGKEQIIDGVKNWGAAVALGMQLFTKKSGQERQNSYPHKDKLKLREIINWGIQNGQRLWECRKWWSVSQERAGWGRGEKELKRGSGGQKLEKDYKQREMEGNEDQERQKKMDLRNSLLSAPRNTPSSRAAKPASLADVLRLSETLIMSKNGISCPKQLKNTIMK